MTSGSSNITTVNSSYTVANRHSTPPALQRFYLLEVERKNIGSAIGSLQIFFAALENFRKTKPVYYKGIFE